MYRQRPWIAHQPFSAESNTGIPNASLFASAVGGAPSLPLAPYVDERAKSEFAHPTCVNPPFHSEGDTTYE